MVRSGWRHILHIEESLKHEKNSVHTGSVTSRLGRLPRTRELSEDWVWIKDGNLDCFRGESGSGSKSGSTWQTSSLPPKKWLENSPQQVGSQWTISIGLSSNRAYGWWVGLKFRCWARLIRLDSVTIGLNNDVIRIWRWVTRGAKWREEWRWAWVYIHHRHFGDFPRAYTGHCDKQTFYLS